MSLASGLACGYGSRRQRTSKIAECGLSLLQGFALGVERLIARSWARSRDAGSRLAVAGYGVG